MVGITPGVQNLHRDLAALGMHGVCHLAVPYSFSSSRELPRERFYPPSPVRRITTRNNQTDLTSSTLGSFFYLIVGLHALHAVVALGLLVATWRRLRSGFLASSQLATAEVFWYFVVGHQETH